MLAALADARHDRRIVAIHLHRRGRVGFRVLDWVSCLLLFCKPSNKQLLEFSSLPLVVRLPERCNFWFKAVLDCCLYGCCSSFLLAILNTFVLVSRQQDKQADLFCLPFLPCLRRQRQCIPGLLYRYCTVVILWNAKQREASLLVLKIRTRILVLPALVVEFEKL